MIETTEGVYFMAPSQQNEKEDLPYLYHLVLEWYEEGPYLKKRSLPFHSSHVIDSEAIYHKTVERIREELGMPQNFIISSLYLLKGPSDDPFKDKCINGLYAAAQSMFDRLMREFPEENFGDYGYALVGAEMYVTDKDLNHG